MTNPADDQVQQRGNFRATGLFAALVIVATILVVGGLAVVARDAPSTAVGNTTWVDRVPIEASAGCDAFASYWLDSVGLDIEPDVLEGFTNCRISDDEVWVIVDETESVDGFSDITDPETQTEIEFLRVEILQQLDELEQSFPDELESGLNDVYRDAPNPVIGHLAEGVPIGEPRSGYAEAVEAFIEDPAHEAFAGYAEWAKNQRIESYAVFRAACVDNPDLDYLSKPCRGMEGNLSIKFIPWPWDLRESHLIDDYLLAVSNDGDES